MTTHYYENVQHVVHISTDVVRGCEHCSELIGGDNFAKSVNHYIEQHGYKLLHTGSEWGRDMDGESCQHTVAVLGR